MILEHRRDDRADGKFRARIAGQVADHPHIVGIRQLDQHHHIRTRVLERGMHRMPYALPTVDASAPRNAMPSEVDGAASMANPFGAELEAAAILAALHHQLVPT